MALSSRIRTTVTGVLLIAIAGACQRDIADNGVIAERDFETVTPVETDCLRCTLVIDDPLVYDSSSLPGMTRSTRIAVNSERGLRVAYGPTDTPGQVGVMLDGTRAFLVGRAGDGPGELGKVRMVEFAGPDTVVILESTTFSALSLLDSNITRASLPPGAQSFEMLVAPDRTVLINNHGAGGPLVAAMTLSGKPRSEFMPAGNGLLSELHLAVADDTTVVAVPRRYEWQISRWTFDGGATTPPPISAPSWFRPYSVQMADDTNPKVRTSVTYVQDVAVLDRHVLIVVGRVEDPRPVPPQVDTTLGRWHYTNDTAVDAYDIRTGQHLASVRVDAVYTGITPEGYLVRKSEDASGFPTAILRKLRVRSP